MKERKNAHPSTELKVEKWGVEKQRHSQNIPSTIFGFIELPGHSLCVKYHDTPLSGPPSGYQDSFRLLQPLEVLLPVSLLPRSGYLSYGGGGGGRRPTLMTGQHQI